MPTAEQLKICEDNGYTDARVVDDRLCALRQFMTTYGLVIDIDDTGYQRRYCYENYLDAKDALDEWDGIAHPSGPWIKLKGTYQGQPIDMFNPNFTKESDNARYW